MEQFKRQKLKSALKQVAKNRGLTYEDLAERLECSLPTVKRYFGAEDLTLSRLLQICEILDVTLAELELMANADHQSDEKFSAEQEQFLVKNRGHLAYLIQLFEGHSPGQIAEKFKLTQRSTDKYLIALERQGLIRVTGSQKVRTSFKDVPKLGGGPLGKAYYQSLIKSGGNFFIDTINRQLADEQHGNKNPSGNVGSAYSVLKMNISKNAYETWAKQLEKVLQDISNLSRFEEKSLPSEELQTMVCVIGHTLSSKDAKELDNLEHVFGEIENL